MLYLVFVAVLVNLEMGGGGSNGVKSNAKDRRGQKVGGCVFTSSDTVQDEHMFR